MRIFRRYCTWFVFGLIVPQLLLFLVLLIEPFFDPAVTGRPD